MIGAMGLSAFSMLIPWNYALGADSSRRNGEVISIANFYVKGMFCAQICPARIKSALRKLNGVKSATVSYENSSAEIHYDENLVSIKDLIDEIEKAGFKAFDNGNR